MDYRWDFMKILLTEYRTFANGILIPETIQLENTRRASRIFQLRSFKKIYNSMFMKLQLCI